MPKNEEQQAIWGGVAGESFDQCYHQACDTIDNVNLEALDVNIDAIALAVLAYSYSTQAVNGVQGVPVPGGLKLPAPAGPEESWSSGGGGLAHDHDARGQQLTDTAPRRGPACRAGPRRRAARRRGRVEGSGLRERLGGMSVPAVTTRPRVVVVGGGIAGLTAALEVLDALPAADVTVLEGSDRLGGKLRLEPVAGHLVDVGAESVLALRPEAVDLADRVGCRRRPGDPRDDRRLGLDPGRPAAAAARHADGGAHRPRLGPRHPHRRRGGAAARRAAVARRAADRGRLGRRLRRRPARAPPSSTGSSSRCSAGSTPATPRRLSLQATMPVLWAAGDPRREPGRHARRTGGPASAPAARAAPRPPFTGLRGGVGRLPGLVADEVARRGATLRTGAVVRELQRTRTGWRLVVGSAADPEVVEADAVLLCVPAAPAARLLAGHAPVAVVGAGRRRDGIQCRRHPGRASARASTSCPGSGFLVPPVEGRTIKASTFSFRKWAWTGALSDEVVHLRASFGRAREEADLQRDDADLVAVAVAEVGEAIGRPLPRVVDAHVQRWGGGLPQYAVGHVDRVASIRADVARLPGLEVAGAVYDGVGIPAVVASATRAAHATVQHLSSTASRTGDHPA